jgi:Spy/CpxP family protein refolding chaperone
MEVHMKKATVLILVLSFILLGICASAQARFRGEGSREAMGLPPVKWWKMPRIAEKLALTQEEVEKMEGLYREHRLRTIDLRGEVEKKRLQLEEVVESSPFNGATCIESFEELQEAHNRMALERFKFLLQVREILGLDRFQQLKEEFRQFRMKRRQGGQPPARRGHRMG